MGPCNVVPGTKGRRGWPKSGELLAGGGQGSGWRGSRSRKEPVWVLTRGGNTAGGRARRRPTAAAVGGGCSGELLLGLSNKQPEGLQRVLGEVLG
jgi:hypothetical protein